MPQRQGAGNWEVLNGVGVDGVGVIFPFFLRMFPLFLRIFPLFLCIFPLFLRFSLLLLNKGQGKTTAIYCKNGEFHSDPVCTDPMQNFPREEESVRHHHGKTFLRIGETEMTTKFLFTKFGFLGPQEGWGERGGF